MGYIDDIVSDYERDIVESGQEIAMDNFNYSMNNIRGISEAEYNKAVNHLRLEILDTDRFIKVNECKPITNPVFYSRNNEPTSDGLLSNTIFGITRNDRAGIFGYIDLGGWYLDPSCYKAWIRIDRNIKQIAHKEGAFSITDKGEIVEDPNGKTGVDFLRKNIDKIVFARNDSLKRDLRVNYLEHNRDKMFINKYLVIPPYYRDTNTGKRSVGVNGINRLYSQLIVNINSLSQTQEYGFDMSGPMQGRIQESLLCLYDWACGNTNASIQEKDAGMGIGSKFGILRHAAMSKTSNYAARLVITSPELKAHTYKDMMSDFDHTSVPLAACIACGRPFVQFYVRRFFEDEFMGTELYQVVDKSGKVSYKVPKDPLIVFSDERIKNEMEKFIHAYNNRFEPIEVPMEDGKVYYMQFKGQFKDSPDGAIFNRRLTWCDVFFAAATEAVKDKMGLITRFPVDSRFNQIFTKIRVASTKVTEQLLYNNTFYQYYPKIREEDISTNTGNKFVDTLVMSNLYLKGLGGDYDGDTVTIKLAYTDEANKELKDFTKSKMNFIDFGGINIRQPGADVVQSLFVFTKVLNSDQDKIGAPSF